MSAQIMFDLVPLGSIIRHSDGTPRPPERHCIKLAAWEIRNNVGRLSRKQKATREGKWSLPDAITLHRCRYAAGRVTMLPVHQTFRVDTDLIFTVLARPAIGSVLVLHHPVDDGRLVHMAESRAAAETWLRSSSYSNAVLQEVTADQVAADVVEGRMPA